MPEKTSWRSTHLGSGRPEQQWLGLGLTVPHEACPAKQGTMERPESSGLGSWLGNLCESCPEAPCTLLEGVSGQALPPALRAKLLS